MHPILIYMLGISDQIVRHQVKRQKGERKVKTRYDAVWVTPQELIAEGILVSKKVCICTAVSCSCGGGFLIATCVQMLVDHLIQTTLLSALGYVLRHHPGNPKSEAQKREDKREQQDMKSELNEVVVDQDSGALAQEVDSDSN